MNLKELIKEVKDLKGILDDHSLGKQEGIKQTVEAVDDDFAMSYYAKKVKGFENWQTLKKLLGVK